MGLLPTQFGSIFNFGGPGMNNIYFLLGFFTLLIALLIMFVIMLVIAYWWLMFPIIANVIPLVGSGNNNELAVGKEARYYFFFRQRFRWNKARTQWVPLFPLFNKDKVEPFEGKHIYPGRIVYCFLFDGTYVAGSLNIDINEKKEILAELNPVPKSIREWQSMVHKQHAIEFAKVSWWDDNKILISAVVVFLGVMATGIIVLYMSYKMVGPNITALNGLTNALNNFQIVPAGMGPG